MIEKNPLQSLEDKRKNGSRDEIREGGKNPPAPKGARPTPPPPPPPPPNYNGEKRPRGSGK